MVSEDKPTAKPVVRLGRVMPERYREEYDVDDRHGRWFDRHSGMWEDEPRRGEL